MELAPCGLDCGACPQKPESCDGCHADNGRVWSSRCGIRICCKSDKGLGNCSQCAEFPCQTILAFEQDKWDHHTQAVGRLRRLRTDD